MTGCALLLPPNLVPEVCLLLLERMRRITLTEIPGHGNMNTRLPHTERGHGAPYCSYSRIRVPEGLRTSTRAAQWVELILILLYPVFFSFPALQGSLRHWDRQVCQMTQYVDMSCPGLPFTQNPIYLSHPLGNLEVRPMLIGAEVW